MRYGKLNKLLNLWLDNNLISENQKQQISDFMKERRKENFFRMLKWLSVIGAIWLVFGLILTLLKLLEIFDKLKEFLSFITNILSACAIFAYTYFWQPIRNILYNMLGDKYPYFLVGLLSFTLFFIFLYFIRKQKNNKNIDTLNISDEQKSILKTNYALDTISAIFLANGFVSFNFLLVNTDSLDLNYAVFPLWHFIGAVIFILLAYLLNKNLYLVFGIYFISLTVGMFSGCGYAAYFLAVTHPLVQVLVGIILIAAGYIFELKLADKTSFVQEKFISTYYWTGLLLTFLALWVATFWGFNINNSFDPSSAELWFSNILLIAISVVSMYLGVVLEKKVFFNYGLTFLIIETYTVIFSHIFTTLPIGVASLILGAVLIVTVKILKKIYLQKKSNGGTNE